LDGWSCSNYYQCIDSNGKKDGLEGVYTESKDLKYEGTFSHGKEIVCLSFDDTKLVLS
jgi:hypothetical protein